MTTVGYATLPVIPSLKGLGAELTKQLVGPAREAAKKAGKDIGDEIEKGVEEGAKGGSNKLGATLGKGGLIAGAALGAGILSAVGTQNSAATLQAKLGLSPADAAGLGKISGSLFAHNYGESLDEVNSAVALVRQGIDKSLGGGALEKLTGQVLSVSKVFEQDLGGVTQALGQGMKTGIFKTAEEGLDLITTLLQQTPKAGEDLLETLNEYGTQFRKLGLQGPTALGLISQGMQAGARDTDIVADALKEFSIRAIDGSKSSAEGFDALGLSAEKMTAQIARGGSGASAGLQTVLDKLRAMKDPVAQSAAATALFGTQAEDLGQALFALDPSKATASLGEFAGAASKVDAVVSGSASASLTSFWRQLKTGAVDIIGGKVIPFLTSLGGVLQRNVGPAFTAVAGFVSTQVIPRLQVLAGWIEKNQGWLVIIGGALLGGVAVWAAWTIATGAASIAMGVFGLVMTGVNKIIALSPLGKALLILGLLVGAFIAAYKSSETFRDIVKAAIAVIRTTFEAWWNFVRGGITALTKFIVTVFGPVVDFFKSLGDKLKGPLGLLKDIIVWPFKTAFNLVAKLWNNTVGKISFHVPDWVPNLGGKGFSMPNIPEFGGGGLVPATPGGRIVRVAEAGEDEIISPVSKLAGLMNSNSSGMSDRDRDLLWALANRPVQAVISQREVTRAVNRQQQLDLARR